MSAVFELLGDHPFFYGMSEEHLQVVVDCASPVDFEQGETIFHEGREADACFLILEGDIALTVQLGRVEARGLVTGVERNGGRGAGEQ